VRGPWETIRLYDIFHAREETTRIAWLYRALVILAVTVFVVAARHGGTRGADIAQA
jgi:hypothetical protein